MRSPFPNRTVPRLLAAVVLCFLAPACGPAENELSEPRVADSAGDASGQPLPLEQEETWDVWMIEGTKVGYVRSRIEPVVEDQRELLRFSYENELTVKRFGQSATQRMALTSVETPAGDLVRFDSRTTAGRQQTVVRGRLRDDQLLVETTTPGRTETETLAWQPAWGGFFAAEQSLRREPMQPGQTRTLRALLPVFHLVGEIQLKAVGYEPTRLLDETRELLRIERTDVLANTRIESVVWVSPDGQIHKTRVPAMGLQSYRTSREVALGAEGQGQFELGEATVVKVPQQLADAHRTRRAVYRARLAGRDPVEVFPQGDSQQTQPLDEQTVQVVVHALRPGGARPPDTVHSPPPTEADSAPNSWIQSDDRRIVEMAQQVAPEETDPWQLACALERHVRQVVRLKNFTQAFASAAEVVQSREGDCTEHAVLLAALCRARQLPARVAIGLVYSAPSGGFAYHMWNEVWIDDRWIPLDATLGQGGIGAAHLKLGHSHLQGANALSAFLPVFSVLGQLELEVVEIE